MRIVFSRLLVRRHPLARLALGLLGLLLLGLFSVLAVGVAMLVLAGLGLRRLLRGARPTLGPQQRPAAGGVIEGEFREVRSGGSLLPR